MKKRKRTTKDDLIDIMPFRPNNSIDHPPHISSSLSIQNPMEKILSPKSAPELQPMTIKAVHNNVDLPKIEPKQKNATDLNTIGTKSLSSTSFLARLKAISSGATLAVPKALPEARVLQKIGDTQFTKPDETKNESSSTPNRPKRNKSEDPKSVISILDYDRPLGFGVAATLQYLSSHGLLIEYNREEQSIIEYKDDDGNIIDSKMAFKHHSHVFSGKAPGEKKKARLRQIAQSEKRRQNTDIGDTPLHTASTLRSVLKEKQQPYLELTGVEKSVLPYKPESNINPKIEAKIKKKKKLKLKKAGSTNE